MYDCQVVEPFCTTLASGDSDCGSFWGAKFFFMSYMVLATNILLGLFIAVLLENLSAVYNRDRCAVTQQDLLQYVTSCILFLHVC